MCSVFTTGPSGEGEFLCSFVTQELGMGPWWEPTLIYILGEQEQRMDLSHPVHADNCVLDPDTGECWREPPAYTYRDYRWAASLGTGR